MKNLQDAGIDNVFFWIKSCRKMYAIFSAVLVNKGKVTSWRLLVTPIAAPSIIKQVSHGVNRYGAVLHLTELKWRK
jgi:hypothetical protein